MVFPYLEELNFSFNCVELQQNLYYCAKQLPRLTTFIISGNPFAITGITENYKILQKLMERKSGVLVNETLNAAPSHLFRAASYQNNASKPPLALMAPKP